MARLTVFALAAWFAFPSVHARQATLQGAIRFASAEEGRKLLTSEDDYTAKWSAFDIVSRVQRADATRADLFALMETQVSDWPQDESARIARVVAELDSIIAANGFVLPLPEEILLVRSGLREEGGAVGYTRENYIVLRPDLVQGERAQLRKVLLHEIFHVLTRKDAAFRRAIYEAIGFTVSNPIPYPEQLASRRITNPDAHLTDSYINLQLKAGGEADCVMMLYAKKDWEGGTFFTYLEIGFVEVTGPDGGKTVRLVNREPVIHGLKDIDGFFQQVGWNTQYVIDPEEIAADNFAHAITGGQFPSPEIIAAIRKTMLP